MFRLAAKSLGSFSETGLILNLRPVSEKEPKLLAASQNIGKFEFAKFDLPYHHSNTDCMNSSFKETYAISVNSRRFYFP